MLGTFGNVPLLMQLQHTHDPFAAGCLILVALVVIAGYTALGAIVKAELFPAEIRSIGVGLPSAIAISIFGSTAGGLALWFKKQGLEIWFFYYVSACIAVSLIVFLCMRESSKTSRIYPSSRSEARPCHARRRATPGNVSGCGTPRRGCDSRCAVRAWAAGNPRNRNPCGPAECR